MDIFRQLIIVIFGVAHMFLSTPIQSQSVDSLGAFYYEKCNEFFRTDVDSFLQYHSLALAYHKSKEDWEEIVYYHNLKGSSLYIQRDYPAFAQNAVIALGIAKDKLPRTSKNYLIATSNYGVASKIRGDYEEALKSSKTSLTLFERTNSSIFNVARTLKNIGVIYRRIGDFDEAIQYTSQAHKIFLDSVGRFDYFTNLSLLDLGHLYRDKKEYQLANAIYFDYLQDVNNSQLKQDKRTLRGKIYAYQGLARSYLKQQKGDSTFYFIQKALALQSGEKPFKKILSYEILGDLFLAKKDYDKAFDYYQQANQQAFKVYAAYDKHLTKARSFRQMADVAKLKKQTDQALALYQKGLIALAFDFTDSSYLANPTNEQFISRLEAVELFKGKALTFRQRYELYGQKADLLEAFQIYEQAALLIRDLRQSFLEDGSKLALAENSLLIHEGAIWSAIELAASEKDDHYLEKALEYAERNKAMVLLESLQQGGALLNSQIPPEELKKEKKLRLDIAFFEQQISRERQKKNSSMEDKVLEWQEVLFDLRRQYDELIAAFEDRYPLYHQLKYQLSMAHPDVIRSELIDAQTAVLEYFVGQEQAYLFCLTQDRLEVHPIAFDLFTSDKIARLRQIAANMPLEETFLSECREFGELAYEVYEKLLAPALDALPNAIRRLLIVPDDRLSLLPFGLLLRQKTLETPVDYKLSTFDYLLEDFALTTNYSLSLLLYTQKRAPRSAALPFVGYAPEFGQRGPLASNRSSDCFSSQIFDLACNRKEVAHIHRLMGGEAFLGLEADQKSFLEKASKGRILHLATHACVNEENTDQSRIHFADNYISSLELQSLELQAELAVLSACNTGSGKLVKGEGVMSLSRNFILAGCASTLMSLWAVDDCTTSSLMKSFYEALAAGQTKDEALRQACLQHLEKTDRVGGHPYYWAAFVQSGEAAPLRSYPSWKSWYYLLLLVPLALLGLWLRRKTA
ncbi:MAG: CHAT domain-containing tetratricopeptide repeat protein [Bacteroidota bacterium]